MSQSATTFLICSQEAQTMRPFSLAISRTDMNRLAVIFVEGDTEVDFYKKLVSYYRNQHGGRLSCRVEIRNVRGVGN